MEILASIVISVITSGLIIWWYERKVRLEKAKAEAELIRAEARKKNAEAVEIETRARDFIDELIRQAVEPLKKRIAELEEKNAILEAVNIELRCQLKRFEQGLEISNREHYAPR